MGQDAKLEHRLAAIMATDVVGYSQSMQSDEAGTLAALGPIREATQNHISHHGGSDSQHRWRQRVIGVREHLEAVVDLDDGASFSGARDVGGVFARPFASMTR
jgi:class 3 adenylate cyclase